MDGIFISYRRDDAAGYAGRLYDRLASHFGPQRVFMDVEGIEPGTDFIDAIDRAVTSCRVLIVMIGSDWVGAVDADGKRRLDDPMDFVRIETAMALKRNIRVVPVLLDGAPMPRADQLPEDLVTLTRRQAIEVSHKQWEASTGELIRTLERIFTPLAGEERATPPDTTSRREQAESRPEPAGDDEQRRQRKRPAWLGLSAIGVALAVALAMYFSRDRAPASPAVPPIAAAPQPATAPAPPTPKPSAPTPTPAPAAPPAPPPAPPAAARIAADVTQLDFGRQDVGGSARARLRLVNEGEAAGKLARPRIEGSKTFAVVANGCSASLAPSRRCDITLAFKPPAAGTRSAELVVGTESGELRIALTGSGVTAAPVAAPAPPAVPAPQILSLTTRADGTRHTLCYRVSDATAVSLAPQPGALARADKDCVSLAVERPTTYTLTAKNDSGTVRRSIAVAPPEVARPERGEPAVSAVLPSKGERWVYRTRGKWPTSPKRTVAFTVQSAGDGLVVEQLSQLEPEPVAALQTARSRAGAPAFASWSSVGSEFAPWLAATESWQDEAAWNNVRTPAMGEWDDWYTRGKITGREQVSVPAGSYSAWKAEVWSSRRATGSDTIAAIEPVRVQYLMWYDPGVKRYVKMVRRITSANGNTIEEDVFELVAHRQP